MNIDFDKKMEAKNYDESNEFIINESGSHSPNKDNITIEKNFHKNSNSIDDFEHLDHNESMDVLKTQDQIEFNSLTEPNILPTYNSDNDFQKNNIDKSLLFESPKHSLGDKIDTTKDFMEIEKSFAMDKNEQNLQNLVDIGEPNREIKNQFVENIAKSCLTNLKEDNEKFISSEDLLGDFKDEQLKPDSKLLSSEKIKGESAVSHNLNSNSNEENKTLLVSKDKQKLGKQSLKMISAEMLFYKFGLDTWFRPERLHPKVESLIYWRDVRKSGIVFGAGFIILVALSCCSVISVIAYTSLITLIGTVIFRIYKNVRGAIQKTSEGHPFKELLDHDFTLSEERVQNIVNVSVVHINATMVELRRLFLVEDLVDSIKFGVFLLVLTYVGAWFNGMTLIILAFVALFTLPKVYESNKQSIDMYLDLVRTKFLEITDKVKTAIPMGKKPETDKEK